MELDVEQEKSEDIEVDLSKEDSITNEIVDPGSLEGKPKPKLNEPSSDHPRFKQIYGKMKEYERKLNELQSSNVNETLISEMREHNAKLAAKLAEVMENSQKSTIELFTKQNEPDPIKELETKISSLLSQREVHRKAMEHDKADFINDQLVELRTDLSLAKKDRASSKSSETSKIETIKQPDNDDDSNLEEKYMKVWVSKNPWFTKNESIKKQAIAIDKKLLSHPDWKDKSIIERLDEVEKQIKSMYSGKQSTSGFASVEDGNSGAGKIHSESKITLTAAQVAIANGLGISPQQYAKQQMLLKRR